MVCYTIGEFIPLLRIFQKPIVRQPSNLKKDCVLFYMIILVNLGLNFLAKQNRAIFGWNDKQSQRSDQKKVDSIEYHEIIQKWYNRFRFNEDALTVYNQVSLGVFFNENGKFTNYWFSTGSPSFIFKVFKQQEFDF